uniref:Uncharacterized protein n=1 Tax=Pyrodinium bahamense TaxID=73915 RepID=A0A7S0AB72_9DINO
MLPALPLCGETALVVRATQWCQPLQTFGCQNWPKTNMKSMCGTSTCFTTELAMLLLLMRSSGFQCQPQHERMQVLFWIWVVVQGFWASCSFSNVMRQWVWRYSLLKLIVLWQAWLPIMSLRQAIPIA